jgi:hypothetical protein
VPECRFLVAIVLLLSSIAVVWIATRPVAEESVVALGDPPAWNVMVTYRPDETLARVKLQMDGMARWRSIEYQVDSTEPWMPRWRGRLDGEAGEFIVFDSGWIGTREPMSAEVARRVARSVRVAVRTDGHEWVVDFTHAGFGQPVSRIDQLWHWLRDQTRIVD